MTKTFIELVPDSPASLCRSMDELESSGITFDGYNIPELMRTKNPYLTPEEVLVLRSQERISPEKDLVLHLRTRERSTQQTIDRIQQCARAGASSVLLVTGDAYGDDRQPCTYVHDVLASNINQSPIPIGIAADIYQPEWGRWDDKLPYVGSSVEHLFTQPIFHPSAFESIHTKTDSLLEPEHIHIGITWINSDRSRRYWHEQNNVPLTHLPQGESDEAISRNSIAQAKDVLLHAQEHHYSLYIMLMRNSVDELIEIFRKSEICLKAW